MPILLFPSAPVNGQLYPQTPAVGQAQYQWSGSDTTWRLLGHATTVTPGSYLNANITVNAQGFITAAANGALAVPATTTVLGGVKIGENVQVALDGTISILNTIGVPDLVSNPGVTTITDNVTSSSIDSALSANQGTLLQLQINALVISNNLAFAGLISGTGVMTFVTPEGTLQGFVSGSPLPGPSVANNEYFVIVESAGGFTPPGGLFTVVTQGDWFLSTGIVWQFLNVGYDPPIATTTQYGLTRLATFAETNAGTDDGIAVTPAGLNNRRATEILAGLAEISTQAEANAGVNDITILTPLKLFGVLSSGAITANNILLSPTINGKLNVQSALTDAIYSITSPLTTINVVESATGQITIDVVQATEGQLGGAELATQAETEAGTDNTRIVTPLKLRTAAVYKSDFNAKGDLLSASANDTPLILPVGLNGTVLTADTTQPTGLKWVSPGIYNLDDISGSFDGATLTFNLAILGVPYAPNPLSNISVFLGGIAQTPGALYAYTITGSSIIFTSAPLAGTTFYAFTVRY